MGGNQSASREITSQGLARQDSIPVTFGRVQDATSRQAKPKVAHPGGCMEAPPTHGLMGRGPRFFSFAPKPRAGEKIMYLADLVYIIRPFPAETRGLFSFLYAGLSLSISRVLVNRCPSWCSSGTSM